MIGTNGGTDESRSQDTSKAPSSAPSASKADEAADAVEIQRRKEISREIESLSPPCQVEFQCSLLLTERPGGSTPGDSPNKAPTHSQVGQVLQGGAAAAVKKAKLHVHVSDEDGPTSNSRSETVDDGGREPGSKVKARRGKRSRKKGGDGGRSSGDFAESAVVGESDPPLPLSEQLLCLEFEWISGDDKDVLHQILQYFRNKCQNMKF